MRRTEILKVNVTIEAAAQGFSVRKGIVKNSAKFTGKHQCQSLFLNKVAGLSL